MSGFESVEVDCSVLELENVLKDINSHKILDLEIGKKYHVHRIIKFRKRVYVQSCSFKFVLPKSWNTRMTDYNISVINNTNSWIFVVYNGYDIKFTM